MARAPKKCPECPPCEQKAAPAAPTERPDVSSIKGPAIPARVEVPENPEFAQRQAAIQRGEVKIPDEQYDEPESPFNPKSGSRKTRFSFPEFGYYRKAKQRVCETGPNKAALTMLTNEQAAPLKLRPGPALRLCFEENKPGVLVSVQDPQEADTITRAFLSCVRNPKGPEGGDSKACAIKTSNFYGATGPQTVLLGKAPRRRKKAST